MRRRDREMKPRGGKEKPPASRDEAKEDSGPEKTTRRPKVNVQGVGLDAETRKSLVTEPR